MTQDTDLTQYEAIKRNPILRSLFWILFLFSSFLLVYILRFYFWPSLLSVLVFAVMNPLFLRAQKYCRNHRAFLAGVFVFFTFAVLVMPSVYLLISVSREAVRASVLLRENVDMKIFTEWFSSLNVDWAMMGHFGITPDTIIEKSYATVQNGINMIVENMTGFITGSLSIAFDLVIMLVLLFFLLKDSQSISRAVYNFLPFPNSLEYKISRRISKVIQDVFYGNLVIMMLQGSVVFLVFMAFDIPSALLWAVVGGLFSVIPIISTSVVWIPVVIYYIVTDQYLSGVLVGFLCLAAAQLLENIVKPKILDKKLNIHPMILFFALFGGLQAFGIIGLVLGPVIVTLFKIFVEAYYILLEFRQEISDKESTG